MKKKKWLLTFQRSALLVLYFLCFAFFSCKLTVAVMNLWLSWMTASRVIRCLFSVLL